MLPRKLLEWLFDDAREAPLFFGDETKTRANARADVMAMGSALLQQPDVPALLACHDRYHACVGLLACGLARRVALFPPALRADAVSAISERHSGAWVVSDEGEFGTAFSSLLARDRTPPCFDGGDDPNQWVATVYTSGSTGEPVGCEKTAAQLFGEAEFLAQRFGIGSGSRLLASAPPHHLYGLLFGVLVPLSAGAASVRRCSPMPASLAKAIQEHSVDTLCAVPPHLAGLLALEPGELSPLRRVFCSAGRLEADLSDELRQRFAVEVIEIFGSSETGGIAYRTDPRAPWRPFDGVSVRCDAKGVLMLNSPFLPPHVDGPFRSSDRIELFADGTFSHLGRLDDVVKIGGERISVREVERAIRRLDGVRDAAVLRISTAGPRQWELWACIAAADIDAKRMRESLGSVLQPVALPRRVKLVHRLPREVSGKISRERLLELFEDES